MAETRYIMSDIDARGDVRRPCYIGRCGEAEALRAEGGREWYTAAPGSEGRA